MPAAAHVNIHPEYDGSGINVVQSGPHVWVDIGGVATIHVPNDTVARVLADAFAEALSMRLPDPPDPDVPGDDEDTALTWAEVQDIERPADVYDPEV
jgi:hypothetical protein